MKIKEKPWQGTFGPWAADRAIIAILALGDSMALLSKRLWYRQDVSDSLLTIGVLNQGRITALKLQHGNVAASVDCAIRWPAGQVQTAADQLANR